jgi:uncharacterized protein
MASRILLVLLLCAATAMAQKVWYREVAIPVRDGQTLAADLYLEDSTAARPVILVQTPYNKNPYRVMLGTDMAASFPWRPRDYHYLIVDWRGFYGSSAAERPGYDRGLDGYDVVEWAAAQPWCNGRVGTWGGSALGVIQFQTARRQPPHLVCSVPMIKDYQTKYSDYYCGGVFRTEHVQSLERLGFVTVDAVQKHPTEDAFWKLAARNSDYPGEIAVPLLMVTGWFDHFPGDVIRAYGDLRARSDAQVSGVHRLIIGPWTHEGVDQETQGDLAFPNAVGKVHDEALRFFDFYLLGATNGWLSTPLVQYYLLGDERWLSASFWPMTVATRQHTWFLHEGGVLSEDDPPGPGSTDATIIPYDPRDPSPSVGGARFNPFDHSIVPGPLDIRTVERRPDAAVFSSDTVPSQTKLIVLGPGSVTLLVSSDRTDTDIAVRLCDVFPDGRSIILADGIRRLRFRNGVDREELLPAGSIDTVVIPIQDLAWRVLPGHALRLVVTSSNWPRFDRNLNNGGPMYAAGDTLVAHNAIYHGDQWRSTLTLSCFTDVNRADDPSTIPVQPTLLPCAPHPFRAGAEATTVEFILPFATAAHLEVFDITGRRVAALLDADLEPGTHRLPWDGRDDDGAALPSGVYLLRLRTPRGQQTQTMVLYR